MKNENFSEPDTTKMEPDTIETGSDKIKIGPGNPSISAVRKCSPELVSMLTSFTIIILFINV